MSENVNITPGSGDVVGADDISSVKYQRIKIIKGADGVNSGDISDGNPLPISGNVTISQTAAITVSVPSSVTVAQSTATNLKAQAENYQGGSAVSSSNPLFVTLAQTAVVTDSITFKTPLYIKVAYTASQTAATVLTPTSGKKAVITDVVVSASGAGSVYLFDNTDSSTTAIGPTLSLGANGGWDHSFAKMPYATSAINNVVKYTSGSGAIGSIWLEYYEV